MTFLGFGGFAAISLNDVNGTDVENKLGLSYGVGAVLSPTDSFQIGVLFGWDHIGGTDGAAWVHEDQIWYSFVGFNFIK